MIYIFKKDSWHCGQRLERLKTVKQIKVAMTDNTHDSQFSLSRKGRHVRKRHVQKSDIIKG